MNAQCPATKPHRCGTTWPNANSKCGTCCINNGDCIHGEFCYADLSDDPCTICPPGLPYRCGITFNDANTKCGTCCFSNGDCPVNEGCFADLDDEPCLTTLEPTISTNSPTLQPSISPVTTTLAPTNSPNVNQPCPSDKPFRCGVSWFDANDRCGTCCINNADCTGIERCFNGVSDEPCTSTPTTSFCPDNTPHRCGTDYVDANSKCGTCCANNGDCPVYEFCFAALSEDPCLLSPTAPTITPTFQPTSSTSEPTSSTSQPIVSNDPCAVCIGLGNPCIHDNDDSCFPISPSGSCYPGTTLCVTSAKIEKQLQVLQHESDMNQEIASLTLTMTEIALLLISLICIISIIVGIRKYCGHNEPKFTRIDTNDSEMTTDVVHTSI